MNEAPMAVPGDSMLAFAAFATLPLPARRARFWSSRFLCCSSSASSTGPRWTRCWQPTCCRCRWRLWKERHKGSLWQAMQRGWHNLPPDLHDSRYLKRFCMNKAAFEHLLSIVQGALVWGGQVEGRRVGAAPWCLPFRLQQCSARVHGWMLDVHSNG